MTNTNNTDDRLTLHFDSDPGNTPILEAQHLNGRHASIVIISTNHAILDMTQTQQLRDWLHYILSERQPKSISPANAAGSEQPSS